jgi:hypothetical protein
MERQTTSPQHPHWYLPTTTGSAGRVTGGVLVGSLTASDPGSTSPTAVPGLSTA